MEFLRKIVKSKECISYKGLTKYLTNPLLIRVAEIITIEWE